MTEARIIDGKAFAARLRERIAEDVAKLKALHRLQPGLAVVLVGEDPASQIYVKSKGEQTKAAGMHSEEHRLPADASLDQVVDLVKQLNADRNIHGILVQLPLPNGMDPAPVIAAIDPDKDVDGLTIINAGRLASGLPGLVPCTPSGCLMMIQDQLGGALKGKTAVVVGRSNLMGKPMAQLLLQSDCTVTIAHSRTQDLAGVCRGADILVAAVGRAEMVKGDWIKPGAIVIDVGINRLAPTEEGGKGRIVGDVAFEEAKAVAGAITPVPGGVGPMTIACLLNNTLIAARRQAGLE
jgi:methylenetetrahydrofolate dehydrogenase (NADP+)/methenyltetrahydrofolate cyclohydrolase